MLRIKNNSTDFFYVIAVVERAFMVFCVFGVKSVSFGLFYLQILVRARQFDKCFFLLSISLWFPTQSSSLMQNALDFSFLHVTALPLLQPPVFHFRFSHQFSIQFEATQSISQSIKCALVSNEIYLPTHNQYPMKRFSFINSWLPFFIGFSIHLWSSLEHKSITIYEYLIHIMQPLQFNSRIICCFSAILWIIQFSLLFIDKLAFHSILIIIE